MGNLAEIGVGTTMALENPLFSSLLWKLSPASFAVRMSEGRWVPYNFLQLLSRKLVDVAMGRCRRLIVTMPPRHGKPVSKKTPVLCGNGSRKMLGDVVIGDSVITHLGRPRQVTEVFDQGILPALEIKTKTGRVVVAALDHPFLQHELKMVAAGDLRIGDGLAINRCVDPDCADSGRTIEEFRLAGYLVGDECCLSSLAVAVSDLEEFTDLIYCSDSLGFNHRSVLHTEICHSFHMTNAGTWLRDSGMRGKGAYEKRVPDWVFTSNEVEVANFLGAYFATDGAINSRDIKRASGSRVGGDIGCVVEYCSVSKLLLEDTRHLLTRFGIFSSLRCKKGKYKGNDHFSWRLIISERESLINFINRIPVFHEEKRKRLAQWADYFNVFKDRRPRLTQAQLDDVSSTVGSYAGLAKVFNLGEHIIWDIKKGQYKDFCLDKDYFFDEIVEIFPCEADCCCLTVEEDHTFTANDFVVHNSLLVSQYFPAWYIENFPEKEFVLCSYEAEFAASWGAKVRDLLLNNQEVLNVEFNDKNPARHSWKTAQGGGMFCAGAGGPLTGRGANILCIDDPIKNNQEAESLTIRNQLWDWYLTTARTRLHPGGSIVVMMTRWSSDDLIGRLLSDAFYSEKGTREKWEVFNFPAIADPESDLHYASLGAVVNNLNLSLLDNAQAVEELKEDPEWRDILGRKKGESLCPQRYDENDLSLIRGGSSERTWFSLYQQRPGDEADDGNVYHQFDERLNVRPLERNPEMQLFCSFDFNVDPMCVVIGQYERGAGVRQMERVEILEEVVLQNSNTYAMCEVLISRLAKYREGYLLSLEIYGDAAGVQRTANSKKTNWQIVAEHFSLHTWVHTQFIRKKDNPNISDRVNAMNAMMKSADGTKRMYIDSSKCPELKKDLLKVMWQVDSSGNSTTGLLDKRDKRRTHVSDALGYAIEYKFGLRTRAGGRKGIMQ